MLKNIVRLEHVIDGKVGHFLCDNDTPIPAAKEMCFQFLKYLGHIEDQIKAQQAPAQEPALPVEEVALGLEELIEGV